MVLYHKKVDKSMRTLENIAHPIPFDKFAQTWCKKCGTGDSIILVSTGRYTRTSRVLGEGGPFLDEETNLTDDESIYKCEVCGHESGEEEDMIIDNVWTAEAIYKEFHNLQPQAQVAPTLPLPEDGQDEDIE
jgi:hypothetical protein